MWVLLAYFAHGLLQGSGLANQALQMAVESDHEVFGAAVVNVPKAKHKRLSSSLEQAAHQPNLLVTRFDHV
jgi:hypothetical protein